MTRDGVLLALGLAVLAGCRPCDLAPPIQSACAATLAHHARQDRSRCLCPADHAIASSQARPGELPTPLGGRVPRLAIANAPLAADLDSHPANDSPVHLLAHKSGDFAAMSRQVRGFAADEIRNRSAASALEDYYKLAAAEGQVDLTSSGHGILSKHLIAAEKAIQQGLKDRGDVNAIRRQLFEVESQAAKLDAAFGTLECLAVGSVGARPGRSQANLAGRSPSHCCVGT